MRGWLIAGFAMIGLLACGDGAAAGQRLVLEGVDAAATPDAAEAGDVTVPDAASATDTAADGQEEGGDVVLRPDTTPAPDAAKDPCDESPEEPNNAPDAAFPVVNALSLEALLCEDDLDWYAAVLEPGEVLAFEILFVHDDGDLELQWFIDGAGEPSGESVSADDREAMQVGPFEERTSVALQVYGFRGATGPYEVRASIVDVSSGEVQQVAGQVQYEDRVFDRLGFTGELVLRPARQVEVEVIRSFDGLAVATGLTDDDGRFSIAFRSEPDASVFVRARAVVRLDGFVADVIDRTGASAVYELDSEPFEASSGIEPALVALESEVGGAFNITDVTLDAFRFVARYTDERSPRLSYAWQRPQSYACGSCYSDDRVRLGGQLEDPDEYDDHIILHEFAHYFVEHFSADDSPGGAHRDRQIEPLLEYGEGLAYFWAAMVVDDPVVVDNFLGDRRAIDFEAATQNGEVREDMFGTSDGTAFGTRREEVTGAILWDFYDPPSDAEPFDRISLGAEPMMRILLDYFAGGRAPVNVGQRGIELTDWLNAVVCLYPEVRPDVAPILAARGFPWDPVAEANCDF